MEALAIDCAELPEEQESELPGRPMLSQGYNPAGNGKRSQMQLPEPWSGSIADQEELRKAQEELETRYEALRLESDAMSSEIKAHSVQLLDIRRLWVGVLGVSAVAMGALVLGVIALVRSF